MSLREIKQVLFDMSRDNENFPIYDLVKIITDYIYEIPTKCVQTLCGYFHAISSLIELKDGSLVSGTEDHLIKIWRKQQGSFTSWSCVQTLSEHNQAVMTLIELKDGSFASGSYDRTIKIWCKNQYTDIDKKPSDFSNDWSCVRTLSGHDCGVSSLVELEDGSLASGSYDCTIKIWDKNEKKCVRTLSGHTGMIRTLCKLKDGRLMSGSQDRTIRIWRKNIDIDEKSSNFSNDWLCVQTLSGHTNSITSIIELKDGSISSGSRDRTIKIWSKNGLCIRTFSGHNDEVWALIELQDGQLASGSFDNTIKIWNKGRCIQTLSGHTDGLTLLIELKDGSLASGSYDNTIKIWV